MCLFASFATHSFYSQIKHKSPIIWKESHNWKQRYISLLTNHQSPNHQQVTNLWSALCYLSYQTPLTPTCSFFSYVLYLFFSSSGVMLSKKSTLPWVWNTKKKNNTDQWWNRPPCDILGPIFWFFLGGHWASTTINDLKLLILLLLLLTLPF